MFSVVRFVSGRRLATRVPFWRLLTEVRDYLGGAAAAKMHNVEYLFLGPRIQIPVFASGHQDASQPS